MIFLAALVAGTAVASATQRSREDRRRAARSGLGLALLLAGAAHLVNPTPFEQHLPGWIPAVGVVVAVSGVIEILLGAALLRQRPSRRLGQAVAAFLVAVFPANVYVAVAGVEVQGQPSGIYPWMRLPLQAVFVAWALWSTRPSLPDRRPPRCGLLPTIAWSSPTEPAGEPTVVMASLLQLRRFRDVPGFLLAAIRLRSLVIRTPGALRLSLIAIPLAKTFWTLSHWESQADLDSFARHPLHTRVMRSFGVRMAESSFATWSASPDTQTGWPDAHAQLDAVRTDPLS